MRAGLLKLAVRAFLFACYLGSLLACRAMALWPSSRPRRIRRIAVTGTFHNPNWYLSHIAPLAASGVDEILLVVNGPLQPLHRVTFCCPPSWLRRLAGRAAAKFIWLVFVGAKCRADLFVGYHILPGAISALLAGKLLGQPTCYQMTGGPIEIEGGGYQNENWLAGSMRSPSPWIERCAVALARQFDTIVVRGARAEKFLRSHGLNGQIQVITGSVPGGLALPTDRREYEISFVGRLTEMKQPSQVLRVTADLAREFPGLRAVIVGDGPLLGSLRRQAGELGISGDVSFLGKRADVLELLGASRVFLLTSRSEGLPIAMLEAMAMGAVPVVADIGEVRDVIDEGRNGFVIPPGGIDGYVRQVRRLLEDPLEWDKISRAAHATVSARFGLDAVAARWRAAFDGIATHRPGWAVVKED